MEAAKKSASSRKVTGVPKPKPPSNTQAVGYRLVDLACLQAFLLTIVGLKCSKCSRTTLVIHEEEAQRHGLMSVLCLLCSKCGTKTESFNTSVNIARRGTNYDVNRLVVFASLATGETRSGIERFCAIMGMPPPVACKSWQTHHSKISEDVAKAAEDSMDKAAESIHLTDLESGGEVPEVVDTAVSFDGTWAKRGYSSLFGVQAAISVETGKVLDCQVHSKICRQKAEEQPISSRREQIRGLIEMSVASQFL